MSNEIYFTKLNIENIRSFADRQELNLTNDTGRPAPWTLIVGDNGVGKTTLLQCLVRMRPMFNRPPDDNKGTLPNPVEPELAREPENEVLKRLARYGTDSPARLEARLSLGKSFGKHPVGSKSISTPHKIKTRHEIKRINGQITDVNSSGEPRKVDTEEPLVLAYGAGRHPRVANIDATPETDPTVSLFKVESSLCDAEDFLYRLDHASMKGDFIAQKKLDAIKMILSKIIEDIADPQSIEVFAPPSPAISPDKTGIRVNTPYGNVSFDQLSLGYQTVFAWITDIASRLLGHYENSSDPLREPAIVIVDEIDLHLHPSWQRKIREHLTEHFPKIQFIVTAHSPLMALNSLDANVAVLRRSGDHTEIVNDPAIVQGWRLDQLITSELFDLPSSRSHEVENKRTEYRKLMQKDDLSDEEREKLEKLQRFEWELPIGYSQEDEKAMEIIRLAAKHLSSGDES